MSLANYVKTLWVKGVTALSPYNMNKIEKGIDDVTIEVISHTTENAKLNRRKLLGVRYNG